MEETPTVKRPRVWGIVGLAILKGLLTFVVNLPLIDEVSSYPTYYEDWVLPVLYLLLAFAALSIIAGILIAMYKKIGLQAGIAVFGLDLLLGLGLGLTGNFNINILALGLDALVLYYLYRYLTQEPQKTFFS